jgi:hypothetical protein
MIALVPQLNPLTSGVAAMTILSDSVLIESKAARDNQLECITHERATQTLIKVKTL